MKRGHRFWAVRPDPLGGALKGKGPAVLDSLNCSAKIQFETM
jgi:hypothetical protein